MTDRVTVSLDSESRAALDALLEETGEGQSAVIRRALTFYAANVEAASTDAGNDGTNSKNAPLPRESNRRSTRTRSVNSPVR